MGCCFSYCCGPNHSTLKSDFLDIIEENKEANSSKNMKVEIASTSKEDYDTVLDVALRSFTEPYDPLFSWIVKTDPDMDPQLLLNRFISNSKYMLEWVIIPLFKRDLVIIAKNEQNEQAIGTIVMRLPGSPIDETLCDIGNNIIRLGQPPAFTFNDPIATERFNSLSITKDEEKKLLSKYNGKYIYLQIVGTVLQYRGKGIGSGMMKLVTKFADNKKLPLYLETESEGNEKFYMRHLFKTIKKIELGTPSSEQKLPIWLMLREPQGQNNTVGDVV